MKIKKTVTKQTNKKQSIRKNNRKKKREPELVLYL